MSESSRDDALDGLRQRRRVVAAVDDHPDELLRVERVPGCTCEALPAATRIEPLLPESRHELTGFVLAQRARATVAALSFPPPQCGLRSSSSGRAVQSRQRHAARPVREMVDEVEEPVVTPVEVFEDQHQRPPFGDGFEELAPRGERLCRSWLGASITGQPDERADVREQKRRFFVEQLLERAAQLGLRLVWRVAVEDAGVRLHHLADRPERRLPRRADSAPAARR